MDDRGRQVTSGGEELARLTRLGCGTFAALLSLAGCLDEAGPLQDGSVPDAGAADAGWQGRVCGDGSEITTYRQADLDALEGCELLLGPLMLTAPVLDPEPAVLDLSPLSSLRVIEGYLGCSFNPQLESLEGLERLEAVDGLSIGGCGLRSLRELRNLRSQGRHDVIIDSMENLTDLHGLEGIQVIGRNLSIRSNPNLNSLDGLENLQRVDGYINVSYNPLLSQSEIDEFLSRVDVRNGRGGN